MYRQYFELIRYRVFVDLKSESAQAYLGMLWWVLEPLLYLGAFYLIFEVFLQRGGEGFVGFLLCGLVFWRWFDTTIKRASASIQNSIGIINQAYLPKWVFPATEVASGTARFVFVLALFLLFCVFYLGQVSSVWLSISFLLLVQLLLICGVSFTLAAIVPFFPDLRKIIDNAMMLLFYMSGIFFDIGKLDDELKFWLFLNPMAVLIQQYRMVLLQQELPDWQALMYILVLSLVFFVVGLVICHKLDKRYVRVIN